MERISLPFPWSQRRGVLLKERCEGESILRETAFVTERLEGRRQLKDGGGFFFCFLCHLREGSVTDTRCQLNECEEVFHLLQREETNLLQSELLLHLPVEILDVPSTEILLDDLFRLLYVHTANEHTNGFLLLPLCNVFVDNECVLPSVFWHTYVIDAGEKVLHRLRHARLSVEEVSVLLQADDESLFSSYVSGKELLVVIPSVVDPDALRTDSPRESVDDLLSYLGEKFGICVMEFHHDGLIPDAHAVEFIPSTALPFTAIEDGMYPFHHLRVGFRDVSEIVGDDGVFFHCRKCAEDVLLHEHCTVDRFQMAAVSLRLLADSDLRLSVEMVENGCAVSKEPDEKFLHCPYLRGGEGPSNGAQCVTHCVMDMLRRLHGRMGKNQYAEFLRAGFAVNPFSSLLDCLIYAL